MQLGDLLQWCGANLKTGTLRLKRGPIEKQLFFKDGRLFSSVSTSPRETLGQFLIRSGHITEEELFKALIEQEGEAARRRQTQIEDAAVTMLVELIAAQAIQARFSGGARRAA